MKFKWYVALAIISPTIFLLTIMALIHWAFGYPVSPDIWSVLAPFGLIIASVIGIYIPKVRASLDEHATQIGDAMFSALNVWEKTLQGPKVMDEHSAHEHYEYTFELKHLEGERPNPDTRDNWLVYSAFQHITTGGEYEHLHFQLQDFIKSVREYNKKVRDTEVKVEEVLREEIENLKLLYPGTDIIPVWKGIKIVSWEFLWNKHIEGFDQHPIIKVGHADNNIKRLIIGEGLQRTVFDVRYIDQDTETVDVKKFIEKILANSDLKRHFNEIRSNRTTSTMKLKKLTEELTRQANNIKRSKDVAGACADCNLLGSLREEYYVQFGIDLVEGGRRPGFLRRFFRY